MTFFKQNFLNLRTFFNNQEIDDTIKHARELFDDLEIPESIEITNPARKNEDIENCLDIINQIKKFNTVFLGIGGSSLCGQVIKEISDAKNIFFFDNIDEKNFKKVLEIENPFFIIISKSGETIETLAQLKFLMKFNLIKELQGNIPQKNAIILTEEKNSSLRYISKNLSIDFLEHNNKIGGRYSAFSNVGMIPAILSGLNYEEIRMRGFETKNILKNDIIHGAVFNYLFFKKGFSISPFLIYSDRMQKFGEWLEQLISESLGKNSYGATPLHLKGVTFQHSILQLFLDGPQNKFMTIITEKKSTKKQLHISENSKNDYSKVFEDLFNNKKYENLKLISSKNLEDVFEAEINAVQKAFIQKSIPVRHIELDFSNSNQEEDFESLEKIGYLFAYFIFETILTAKLAKINPFDQNAVELVKILTKEELKK